MKLNKDEAYLLSKNINKNSQYKEYEQALRISLFNHIKEYEYLKEANKKFENIPPFLSLLKKEEEAIGVLILLCENYNVDLVKNSINGNVILPESFIQTCEILVANELEIFLMYNKLLRHVEDENIKDIFFRLQALTYNEMLPELRSFTNGGSKKEEDNKNTFLQEDLIKKVGEFSNIANSLKTGNIDPEQINKLLGTFNLPLISGTLLGILGVMMTKEIKNQEEDEKQNKRNKEK